VSEWESHLGTSLGYRMLASGKGGGPAGGRTHPRGVWRARAEQRLQLCGCAARATNLSCTKNYSAVVPGHYKVENNLERRQAEEREAGMLATSLPGELSSRWRIQVQ
jgi:hypothetical protein